MRIRVSKRIAPFALLAFIATCALLVTLMFTLPTRYTSIQSEDTQLLAAPELPTFARDPRPDALQVISARPIFQRDRRPETLTGNLPGNANIADFRLAGTISTGPVKKALFSSQTSSSDVGKYWKREGEQIGQWRIEHIEPGRVTLVWKLETLTLSIAKTQRLTPKQESQRRASTPIYLSDMHNGKKSIQSADVGGSTTLPATPPKNEAE